MGSRLEAVADANADEALGYFAQRPFDNVYMHWLLANGSIGSRDLFLWRDPANVVRGACYYGAQVVLSADDERAADAFATRLRRSRFARMIAGPRRAVERFWRTAQRSMPAPVALRRSQPLYAVEREALRYTRDDATVARATLDELDELVPNSAAMIAGEIGGDPHRASADFRNRTARVIAAGSWWRSRIDGRLAFMCSVGSYMPQTAQLQGVWTPPAMRGHGHASRALGAICDHLLDSWPTLSLYVNDFNAPARALYERVGFTRAGEFQTILFG